MKHRNTTLLAFVTISAFAAPGGGAFADGSIKDAPSGDARKFSWSASLSGASDYIFRGISANQESPTVQGWVTLNHGLFYATVWGSGIDFGDDSLGRAIVEQEIDYYAGIKPTVGPASLDLGVLYYTFPGANDDKRAGIDEQDYFELKAGASLSPITNLTVGGIVYWTPENLGQTGQVWTVEGSAGYTLPTVGIFIPAISGGAGAAFAREVGAVAPGRDQYVYWNAGLSLTVDKLLFDFRYWDTDVDLDTYDERFLFTTTLTLP